MRHPAFSCLRCGSCPGWTRPCGETAFPPSAGTRWPPGRTTSKVIPWFLISNCLENITKGSVPKQREGRPPTGLSHVRPPVCPCRASLAHVSSPQECATGFLAISSLNPFPRLTTQYLFPANRISTTLWSHRAICPLTLGYEIAPEGNREPQPSADGVSGEHCRCRVYSHACLSRWCETAHSDSSSLDSVCHPAGHSGMSTG